MEEDIEEVVTAWISYGETVEDSPEKEKFWWAVEKSY
jgi:hypothetical protein